MSNTQETVSVVENGDTLDQVFEENLRLFFNTEGPDNAIEPDVQNTSKIKAHRLRRLGLSALAVLGPSAGIVALSSIYNPNKAIQIDVDSLPQRPPKAVERYINNVGELFGEDFYDNVGDPKSAGWFTASVVMLNSKHILTAGHALVVSDTNKSASKDECLTVSVATPLMGSLVESDSRSFNYSLDSETPDAGLMIVNQPSWKNPSLALMPKIKIDSQPPQIGQTLFFVNYEPISNNKQRLPSGNSATGPAIYAGIYEGPTSFGDYNIIDGLKSYGKIFDSSSIGGSSGGAVFNAGGELVGITVQSYDGSFSVKSYDQSWNVNLTGIDQKNEVGDVIVQPISKGLIDKLITKTGTVEPSCEPYF